MKFLFSLLGVVACNCFTFPCGFGFHSIVPVLILKLLIFILAFAPH